MPPQAALQQGDFVLVPFPFTDLTAVKVRPAIVVSSDPQGQELILAFITSVMTNHSARGAEVEMLQTDAEFRLAGLKSDSLIRLDKLVTVSSSILIRRLGKAGPITKGKVAAMLRRTFGI